MKRLFNRDGLALVLVVLLALGAGWWWVRSSIPSLDGEWRLSGLRGPVEVCHDAYGVPHVYARDIERRVVRGRRPPCPRSASGRWSSIAAPPTAGCRSARRSHAADRPADAHARIRAAAAAEWSRLGPAARAALTALRRGRQRRRRDARRAAPAARVPAARPDAGAVDARKTRWRSAACWPTGWPRITAPNWSATPWRRVAGADEADPTRPAATRHAATDGARRVAETQPPAAPPPTVPVADPAPAPAAPPPPSARRCWPAPSARSARARLARSGRAARQQQRLGGGRDAHRHRPAHPGQRPAPAHRDAVGLVRAASGGRRTRRAGRDRAGHAVCRHRPQRPHRLGLHQHRRRRAGLRRADLRPGRPARAGRRRAGSRCRWRTRRFPSRAAPTPAPFEVWRTPSGRGLRRRVARVGIAAVVAHAGCAAQGQQRALVLRWSGFENGGYADAFEAVNRAGNWSRLPGGVRPAVGACRRTPSTPTSTATSAI